MTGSNSGIRRRLVSGSLLSVGIVLGAVLFGIVNYFAWKYNERFDWTHSRLYSLSEKTQNVLRELDREVEVVVFLSPVDPLYGSVSELLASYQGASNRIRVRYVDAEKNLIEARQLVERFELSQLDVIVFESGEDRRVVDTADLADYDYSGLQFGEGATLTGFRGEQVFTSTLVELMENRKPKILFTLGHGELQLGDFSARGLSAARDLLGKDNFEMEEWSSLGQQAVPEGTDLLVIAGPTSTFIAQEVEAFRRFLLGGGRMLVLLDPTLAPTGGLVHTGIEPLLAEFDVIVGDDLVVDPASPLPFFSAETIFVTGYGDHPITRALDQAQLPVIVPLARSVRAGDGAEGWRATELMMTTADGWGETDLGKLEEVAKHDSDLAGPVSLGVAVSDEAEAESEEGTDDEEKEGEAAGKGEEERAEPVPPHSMRLVVIGDSDFATNGQLQNVPNAVLLADAFNWLVQREALLGIPPKQPEQIRLNLSSAELTRISWLVLAGLPGLAIALGVSVYLRRRR